MRLTHVLVHIHTIGSYCSGQDLHAATSLDIWLLGSSVDFFIKPFDLINHGEILELFYVSFSVLEALVIEG